MAPTSCTILEYLSRPNPKLKYTSPGHGTLTVHDRWLPIEGVRPWEDFTFDILSARYKSSLNKTITTYDPAQVIRHSCLDEIAGEDTVLLLLTINNIVPVSNALYETKKGFHFGPGSKFFRQQADGSPDYGLGYPDTWNEGLYTLRNFCPGDIKPSEKWTGDGLFNADWSDYLEDNNLAMKARPLEQAQHYGISLGARYTWIMTDNELVVIRITSSTDEPRSPRPSRIASHRRIWSDTSNLSGGFSAMSIDTASYSGHSGSSTGINPASLEIARIPWSAGSQKSSKGKAKEMTINLALYFLALLAIEGCSISTSYPPLDPTSSKGTKSAQAKASSASTSLDSKSTTSNTVGSSQQNTGGYDDPTEQEDSPDDYDSEQETTDPLDPDKCIRTRVESTRERHGTTIYYCTVAEGKYIEVKEEDWVKGTITNNGQIEECYSYTGRSGTVYYILKDIKGRGKAESRRHGKR